MFWFLKRRPLVSICIPAYDSEALIASVMESALHQSVGDFEIIVSNDGGLPTPALKPYRQHPRVRIFDQRNRLGWVNNTNAALKRARGQYFMVLPHDDLLAPSYVEECLSVLEKERQVFAVCSDIEYPDGIMKASEVKGEIDDRIRCMMRNLYNGYSYRALMRREPSDWPSLAMRRNPPADFCVDTTWILQQSLLGELHRIPKPLYEKRYHDRNVHTKWHKINAQKLMAAWWFHCDTLGALARARIGNEAFIEDLVTHRRNPRRVRETPHFLRVAFDKAGKSKLD